MAHRFSSVACSGILSIGIAAFAPTMAAAQTPISTLNGMPSFAAAIDGKNVKITADGVQREGRVASFSTTGLVLVEDGASVTIPFDKVMRVEKSTHHLRNGTLIGLAAGAGLGLAGMAGICSDEYCYASDWVLIPAFYGGLGAAAGVGIGAIVKAAKKHDNVIYDARRTPPPTIAVAPIVSKLRKGVAVSVSWR
jgi:hypothetical protein